RDGDRESCGEADEGQTARAHLRLRRSRSTRPSAASAPAAEYNRKATRSARRESEQMPPPALPPAPRESSKKSVMFSGITHTVFDRVPTLPTLSTVEIATTYCMLLTKPSATP